MLSSRTMISGAWRSTVSSCGFIKVTRLKEESNCYVYHNRGYVSGHGKLGSKDETHNGSSKSHGDNAHGHRSFKIGGQFSGSHCTESQNHCIRGRKPSASRLRPNSRRRGFDSGFRMPDFDPGKDQLKKIFENQKDSRDPIGELDLGFVGPIEGNFRDDDDSESEDFHNNA